MKHTFKVVYTDKDYHRVKNVGEFDSKDEAIDRAYEFLVEELNDDFDNDEESDVKFALEERNYYVCGYGNSDIEIFEC